MIWSAVLPSPVVSIIHPSMLGLIIIGLFAGFLGIFTYDFFTKKKTEVNGAHAVVGFPVAGNCNAFLLHIQSWLSARVMLESADLIIPQVSYSLSLSQITGGSSGIGKALAIKLAKSGANITILARNMVRHGEMCI